MQERLRTAAERTPTGLLLAQELFWLLLGWAGGMLSGHRLSPATWGPPDARAAAGAAAGLLLGRLDLELSRRLPACADTLTPLLFRRFGPAGALAFTAFAALAEETLFRGWLEAWLGPLAATLLFVVAHVQYLRRPPALLAVALYGSLLAALRTWSGGLLAPWLAHWGIDAVQALAVVFDRYPGLPPRGGAGSAIPR